MISGHPYAIFIFLDFLNSPTHYASINIVLKVNKNGILRTHPRNLLTQFRNGPKKNFEILRTRQPCSRDSELRCEQLRMTLIQPKYL